MLRPVLVLKGVRERILWDVPELDKPEVLTHGLVLVRVGSEVQQVGILDLVLDIPVLTDGAVTGNARWAALTETSWWLSGSVAAAAAEGSACERHAA